MLVWAHEERSVATSAIASAAAKGAVLFIQVTSLRGSDDSVAPLHLEPHVRVSVSPPGRGPPGPIERFPQRPSAYAGYFCLSSFSMACSSSCLPWPMTVSSCSSNFP